MASRCARAGRGQPPPQEQAKSVYLYTVSNIEETGDVRHAGIRKVGCTETPRNSVLQNPSTAV
jgi:hypothetical protein